MFYNLIISQCQEIKIKNGAIWRPINNIYIVIEKITVIELTFFCFIYRYKKHILTYFKEFILV
jgi:hypothetical protein